MKIEILYFESCPHHRPAMAAVYEVIREEGVVAEVREVEVRTAEEAQVRRFLGSPTVRVNGVDIEPAAGARTDFSLSCRLYNGEGTPPRELIRAAITEDNGGPHRANDG